MRVVKIRLRSGGQLKARLESERLQVADLHRELQQSQFVRIGEDTVVRSEDVEALQVLDEDGGRSRSQQRREAPRRPRAHRLVETRPFLFTSEFVLAVAAWVALLLTTLATDSIDAVGFWLLSVAIAAGYMVSRGFAKANATSESWDPREELQPGR